MGEGNVNKALPLAGEVARQGRRGVEQGSPPRPLIGTRPPPWPSPQAGERIYDGLFPVTTAMTALTFYNVGNPTGLKFVVEHGVSRAFFEMGIEHAPGVAPFSLGLRPRPGRELADLQAVGMAPRGTGVLESWDGRTSLFLSHLHLDHVALVPCVPPEVPLYFPLDMEPLRRACVEAGYLAWREPAGTPVPERGRVRVGEIEVEFVAVDHDLPGASGFLIRTPDLTIAYTGDHRWHGLHPERTAAFAATVAGADVLIQEVVSLGFVPPADETGDSPPPEPTEADVIAAFGPLLDRAPGLVVANLYPMNRERVHALGAACAAASRRLLLEPQAATMAGWPHVLDDPAAVRREPAGHCVQGDFWSLPRLIDLRPPPGSIYVHSNGVPLGAFDPAFAVMRSWTDALGLEMVWLGASGHSRPDGVRRMVEAVRPGVVLPVHSRRPEALQVPGVPALVPEPLRTYTTAELRSTP
jgi:ribonuclease J